MDNFLEVQTVKEANLVSLDDYVFLERLSAERNCYVFKKRQRRQ